MTVQEVDIGTSERSIDRDLMRTLNQMSHSIALAYSIDLKPEKVDAGPVRKLLVQLNLEDQREHDDLVDVWRYNRKFDFASFARAPYRQRCQTLLAELQNGLRAICTELHLDPAPLEKAHAGMVKADFCYRYTRGKPVANREAGLSAQLALILTPLDSAVVAEVSSTESGPVHTVTFVKQASPGLRFEVQYMGKVQWANSTTLRLLPKDTSIAPIEVHVEA